MYAVLVFAAMLACAGLKESRAEPFPKDAENLLKWGEFDSLALILEPWLSRSGPGAGNADSVSRAKANLYLGVAYSTAGKAFVADQAFLRAFRFDPGIHPDRFYVSKPIVERFEAIAEEERRRILVRKRESEARDSAARSLASRPTTPSPKPAPVAFRKRRSTWIWWTAGAAGVAAAGTLGFILMRQEPEKKPDTVTELGVD